MAGFVKYKSYSFVDKDPIIDKLRTVVGDSGRAWEDISRASGVSEKTLGNWFIGNTKRPYFATVEAVGRACGKTLAFTNTRKKR